MAFMISRIGAAKGCGRAVSQAGLSLGALPRLARMVKIGSASNNAGFDIRRVSTCQKRSPWQFAARRDLTRRKEAVRRLHHRPPDGFAKLLSGENFGASIPALHFGGKRAMTRPFHGYAQLELLDFGLSF